MGRKSYTPYVRSYFTWYLLISNWKKSEYKIRKRNYTIRKRLPLYSLVSFEWLLWNFIHRKDCKRKLQQLCLMTSNITKRKKVRLPNDIAPMVCTKRSWKHCICLLDKKCFLFQSEIIADLSISFPPEMLCDIMCTYKDINVCVSVGIDWVHQETMYCVSAGVFSIINISSRAVKPY